MGRTRTEMHARNDWNTTEAATYGEFKALPAGAYVCTIMESKETKSRSGRDMLELSIDIVEGDYKSYFADKWRNDTRTEKKWGAVIKQPFEDADGHTSKFFKALETAVEQSNMRVPDAYADWRGLKVGVLFRREEYEKDMVGTTGWVTKPFAYLSAEAARAYTGAPKDKPLDPSKSQSQQEYMPAAYQTSAQTSTVSTPDDDLPF